MNLVLPPCIVLMIVARRHSTPSNSSVLAPLLHELQILQFEILYTDIPAIVLQAYCTHKIVFSLIESSTVLSLLRCFVLET